MEIALKSLFGALVAVGIHFAANSKHPYLMGLVPSIPIFALFGHAMFASSGRSSDLQGAAHFGLATIGPFVLYLAVVWWLATRTNMWVALIAATAAWAISTLVVFAIWNRGIESITNLLNTRFAVVVMVSTLVGSLLAAASRGYQRKRPRAKQILTDFVRFVKRPRLSDRPLIGFIAIAIGSTYLLTSHIDVQSKRDLLPGEERVCGLLTSALTLDPADVATQGIQQSVFDRYVALATNATSAGDTDLANIYSGRAREVLFGSWVDSAKGKPKFC